MDDNTRDLAQEAMLMDIIAHGQSAVRSYLNDTDEQVEQELRLVDLGYDIDEFGDPPMHMEEVDREDGSGDPMPVQEGDRDAGSGDRTESGQEVYMLVKHVLTS